MIRPLRILLAILAVSIFSSCHDTIHMHPTEAPVVNEKALLTLRIDNSTPRLGAVVDYTISPAVIIYSDDLPETAVAHARSAVNTGNKTADEYAALLQRARSLAGAFDKIAPYILDGDKWELHLKYELYAGTAEQVKKGFVSPFYSHDVKYRADVLSPEHDVEVELPFGSVTVVAVACIVPVSIDGDWFFNTTTLNDLVCNIDRRQGEHDNVYRDCFIVGQEFFIAPTGTEGNVQHISATLTRPQGRYLIIADDYEKYLTIAHAELANSMSYIYYPSYINVAYSVLDRRPTDSAFNFGYSFVPVLAYADDMPYVRLGDDWSFVNGDRSNFNIDIIVKDKRDNSAISSDSGILVPVFPGRVTLVVGHWLSQVHEGGGGISIDPNFTDEIVIHF